VHGLAPLCSAFEPVGLTTAQRVNALEATVDETAGCVLFYAGTSDYRCAATFELGKHMVDWL